MDIHILHDGKPMGPYTEEAAHALLKQGAVLVNDPAWRPGMPEWMPLLDLLYPRAAAPVAPPPPPPVVVPAPAPVPREAATPRQQAFLSYMRIPFAPEITREEASLLVNDAMENPKDPARIARWNEERLQLHPELFAAEIQSRKENRPQRFLEICQDEGAPYFEKVTKAHCQVLVGHLDVRFPNWDAYERDGADKYFFPALAEKFPQLVTAEGKGRFKFDAAVPVIRKTARQAPAAVRARTLAPEAPTIFSALFRGVVLGLVILGALWGGRELLPKKKTAPKSTPVPAADANAPSAPPSAVAPATPAASAEPTEAKPVTEPAPAPSAEPAPMKPAGTEPGMMTPPPTQ